MSGYSVSGVLPFVPDAKLSDKPRCGERWLDGTSRFEAVPESVANWGVACWDGVGRLGRSESAQLPNVASSSRGPTQAIPGSPARLLRVERHPIELRTAPLKATTRTKRVIDKNGACIVNGLAPSYSTRLAVARPPSPDATPDRQPPGLP